MKYTMLQLLYGVMVIVIFVPYVRSSVMLNVVYAFMENIRVVVKFANTPKMIFPFKLKTIKKEEEEIKVYRSDTKKKKNGGEELLLKENMHLSLFKVGTVDGVER
mmetsp:Transcript_8216/g.11742  ORF Transcript_8216/g.11742 Transcript_8216/m.11742 type:complete len:105 (-) Transcript_8216:35-349(-)